MSLQCFFAPICKVRTKNCSSLLPWSRPWSIKSSTTHPGGYANNRQMVSMVQGGSLKASQKRGNRSLSILACLIGLISALSMLSSWLYLSTDVTHDASVGLQTHQRQPRKKSYQVDQGREKPPSTIPNRVLNSAIYSLSARWLGDRIGDEQGQSSEGRIHLECSRLQYLNIKMF